MLFSSNALIPFREQSRPIRPDLPANEQLYWRTWFNGLAQGHVHDPWRRTSNCLAPSRFSHHRLSEHADLCRGGRWKPGKSVFVPPPRVTEGTTAATLGQSV